MGWSTDMDAELVRAWQLIVELSEQNARNQMLHHANKQLSFFLKEHEQTLEAVMALMLQVPLRSHVRPSF
jgi:hypothetical protein